MKRVLILMTIGLLLAFCGPALAEEEAAELSAECAIVMSGQKNANNMTDRKYTTYSECKSMKNPVLTVSSDKPIYGLYLCFQRKPESYEIQVKQDGDWVTVEKGNSFIHAFYALDGVKEVRLYALGEKKQVIGFNEVYVFGEGRIPSWVQQWRETPEKSDILFVVAHPEEELLYLGGAIPYYAAEQERTVAVALMSYANTTRRSEFLNGLWSMGYRNYPVIGDFKTAKAKGLSAAYKTIDGKNGEKVLVSWLSDVIARTRPEVVVGPAEKGEGNNGQRLMLADACRKAFDVAADRWQIKKLYLHLYGNAEDQVKFDWDQPLEKLGGRTGMGLAYYAYLYHKTQDDQGRSVYQEGIQYANNTFGLAESMVGEDRLHNDFLENIPLEDLTEPVPAEESAGWTLADVPGLPALNGKGFLEEGEFIWSDDARGHYVFISTTVKLVIQRKFDGSMPLTWFETEIWCDLEAGEKMVNLEYTPEKAVGKKSRVDAAVNAVKNKLVFACNGDYYTYRAGSKNGHPTGIEIRDGVKTYSADQQGMISVTFRDPAGLEFFKNYMRDFEGLPDITDKKITVEEAELRVSACTDFIREFLYTYTWGQESYSHEVQEQFGYFTIEEYREFLESLGAKVIRADDFLEPGYPEHLRSLVTLTPDVFPDSNCIVVAEKNGEKNE